jgi:hypothetical protein
MHGTHTLAFYTLVPQSQRYIWTVIYTCVRQGNLGTQRFKSHHSANAHGVGILPSLPAHYQKLITSSSNLVLQERLVSPRILHYSAGDMFWECFKHSTRESDILTHKLARQNPEWQDVDFKRSLQFSGSSTSDQMRSDAMQKWYRIVSQYSRLEISIDRDRFPALSGIARRIHEVTGYTYVAGLWQEDVHRGLLWYSDEGSNSKPRQYIAPSWSWAASKRPVLQLHAPTSRQLPSRYDLQILNLESGCVGDPFGVIKSARLSVLAYITSLWIKSSHGSLPYNSPYLKLVLDIYNDQGLPVGTGYLDEQPDDSSIRQCKVLAISEQVDEKLDADKTVLYLLLVEEVEDTVGQYRRVGIGQTLDPFLPQIFDARIFEEQKAHFITLV